MTNQANNPDRTQSKPRKSGKHTHPTNTTQAKSTTAPDLDQNPVTKQPPISTRELTGKQRHFARCLANGMTMTESYIEAYEASNMKRSTINEAASRLNKDERISARVQQLIALKEQALIRSTVGLKSQVLTKLVGFMDNATPQDTAKLRAAELLGKSIGLFKEVIEDNRHQDKSPEELTALLHEKLSEIADQDNRTVN
jgi:hypothetical protein